VQLLEETQQQVCSFCTGFTSFTYTKVQILTQQQATRALAEVALLSERLAIMSTEVRPVA
jgi:hypothetical protein